MLKKKTRNCVTVSFSYTSMTKIKTPSFLKNLRKNEEGLYLSFSKISQKSISDIRNRKLCYKRISFIPKFFPCFFDFSRKSEGGLYFSHWGSDLLKWTKNDVKQSTCTPFMYRTSKLNNFLTTLISILNERSKISFWL